MTPLAKYKFLSASAVPIKNSEHRNVSIKPTLNQSFIFMLLSKQNGGMSFWVHIHFYYLSYKTMVQLNIL